MSANSAATGSDCEVMAAVDAGRLVIAELCREDAWLSVPEGAAVPLSDRR